MIRKFLAVLGGIALLGGATQPVHAQNTPVDIQLALLVDVSGSIDATEFGLQRTGYVNAFSNTAFWNGFETSGRSLAVSFTYWSGAAQQSQLGGSNVWYEITGAATAQTFADDIGTFLPRPFSGSTAPGNAINYIAPLFATSGYDGTTKIIDVSGDGCRNDGVTDVKGAGDNAISSGINKINGLYIGADNQDCPTNTSLQQWYQANIVNGGGFLEHSTDFADFNTAIERKIGREVGSTVPEPTSMMLLASGLVGMAAVRRRRKKS